MQNEIAENASGLHLSYSSFSPRKTKDLAGLSEPRRLRPVEEDRDRCEAE